MCNCNEEILEKINDRIKEDLTGKNVLFDQYRGRWSHGIMRLDKSTGGNVMMNVDYQYQGFKSNGDQKKNKTKGSMLMAMSFCPFCGVEYK